MSSRQYIDLSRFIRAAQSAAEVRVYVPTNGSADLGLHPLLKKSIADKGDATPSRTQYQTIPHRLTGKDIVGITNTGTGETTALSLPTLHRLLNEPCARAATIARTRELAQQIEEELRSIAGHGALPHTTKAPIGGLNRPPGHRSRLCDLRERRCRTDLAPQGLAPAAVNRAAIHPVQGDVPERHVHPGER